MVAFVVSAFGVGACGTVALVACRYALVRREDNAVSIQFGATAAGVGVLAVLCCGVLVVTGRRIQRTGWLMALPALAIGAASWRAFDRPPDVVAGAGVFMVIFAPVIVLGLLTLGIGVGMYALNRRFDG